MSLYNLRNPAVKRLMKEAEELLHPTDEYHAQPLEDNLFEWHFTLRGPPNSDYEGGIYHGRITLPADYPMKPPSIILLTPNGRFETNKKICLSISGHHPESWQPSWSIRTALLAIIGFMPTHGSGALGSLDYTPEERRQLALKSQDFQCSECGYVKDIFLKKKSFECSGKHTSQEPSNECTFEETPKEHTYQQPSEIHSHESQKKHSHEYASDLEEKQNEASDVLLSETTNICSKSCISKKVHSKDDETSLIHRHKSSKNLDVKVEEVTTSETTQNLLYSVFIIVIVAIILFLCIRRLFSM